MSQTTAPDRVDRAMRWVGDLDHPFYSDERQRYVWYEASAIGFQLFVILQLALIGAALLFGGRDALSLVMFAFPPLIIATIVAELYARKHRASYLPRWSDMRRGRSAVILGVGALYVAGAARIAFEPDAAGNEDPSLLLGAIAGFGGLALASWWKSLKNTNGASEDDLT